MLSKAGSASYRMKTSQGASLRLRLQYARQDIAIRVSGPVVTILLEHALGDHKAEQCQGKPS